MTLAVLSSHDPLMLKSLVMIIVLFKLTMF